MRVVNKMSVSISWPPFGRIGKWMWSKNGRLSLAPTSTDDQVVTMADRPLFTDPLRISVVCRLKSVVCPSLSGQYFHSGPPRMEKTNKMPGFPLAKIPPFPAIRSTRLILATKSTEFHSFKEKSFKCHLPALLQLIISPSNLSLSHPVDTYRSPRGSMTSHKYSSNVGSDDRSGTSFKLSLVEGRRNNLEPRNKCILQSNQLSY